MAASGQFSLLGSSTQASPLSGGFPGQTKDSGLLSPNIAKTPQSVRFADPQFSTPSAAGFGGRLGMASPVGMMPSISISKPVATKMSSTSTTSPEAFSKPPTASLMGPRSPAPFFYDDPKSTKPTSLQGGMNSNASPGPLALSGLGGFSASPLPGGAGRVLVEPIDGKGPKRPGVMGSFGDPSPRPPQGYSSFVSVTPSRSRDPFTEPLATNISDQTFSTLPKLSSEEDIKCWVTIFGFPPDLASYIIRTFAEYGTIVTHRHPPSATNYIHVKYSTEFEAKRALASNGKNLNGALIVGVLECMDKAVLSGHVHEEISPSQPMASTESKPAASSLLSEPPRKRARTENDFWSKILRVFA